MPAKLFIASLLILFLSSPLNVYAKPDRDHKLLSPPIVGDFHFCSVANVGSANTVPVHITIFSETGSVAGELMLDLQPGASQNLTSAPGGENATFQRCEVEWFGQEGDLLGSFCGNRANPDSDVNGIACLPMQK